MTGENRKGLEAILQDHEPDSDIRKTVLGTYDTLTKARARYFANGAEKDGMLICIGYDPSKRKLPLPEKGCKVIMNGFDLNPWIEGNYSVHNEGGQEFLRHPDEFYSNGAIDIEAKTGLVRSHKRQLHLELLENLGNYVPMVETRGEEFVDVDRIGLDLKKRKELSGGKTGLGTRHISAYTASAVDPSLYLAVMSRQTGLITMFKGGKVLFSEIPHEIHPSYRKSLEMSYAA